MRKDYNRGRMMITILVLVGIMGIGYALLGANLKINGVAEIPASSWNVRFKAGSINVTNGSVTVDTTNNEKAATIDNATQVSYAVRLALPGDFYEFTVTAENTGSIDAMIDSVVSKLGDTVITTGTLPSYLDYSVTYSDGVTISPNQILASNTEEEFKVRLEFKKDIETSELPSSNIALNINFQINYVQADSSATKVYHPTSFADDDWDTIVGAVQNGNISAYQVGDTKTVDMGTFGTHTLRVANKSTPSECESAGFSQSACGFVLEFADIITTHRINPYINGNVNGTGTKGGWEYSEMRTYVNSDIYNALPTALKNSIINTTVVSGHGNNDSANFTTTDKLYLLSSHEVWEDVGTGDYGSNYYDTAYNNTRQLDYYANLEVTTSYPNYAGAIKQNNGSNSGWWLRSARSDTNYCFWIVGTGGYSFSNYESYYTTGVAPAFRLG